MIGFKYWRSGSSLLRCLWNLLNLELGSLPFNNLLAIPVHFILRLLHFLNLRLTQEVSAEQKKRQEEEAERRREAKRQRRKENFKNYIWLQETHGNSLKCWRSLCLWDNWLVPRRKNGLSVACWRPRFDSWRFKVFWFIMVYRHVQYCLIVSHGVRSV